MGKTPADVTAAIAPCTARAMVAADSNVRAVNKTDPAHCDRCAGESESPSGNRRAFALLFWKASYPKAHFREKLQKVFQFEGRDRNALRRGRAGKGRRGRAECAEQRALCVHNLVADRKAGDDTCTFAPGWL